MIFEDIEYLKTKFGPLFSVDKRIYFEEIYRYPSFAKILTPYELKEMLQFSIDLMDQCMKKAQERALTFIGYSTQEYTSNKYRFWLLKSWNYKKAITVFIVLHELTLKNQK